MEAIIVYGLLGFVGYKLWRRFAVPYAMNKYEEARERRQWAKARDPATPEETQQAVLQLRLAHACIEKVPEVKSRDEQFEQLRIAELALQKAAKLDPNATFRDKVLDNAYFTYTFDFLASELYHYRAALELSQAEHDFNEWVDVDQDFSTRQSERSFKRSQKELHDKAEDYAKRAVEFQPNLSRHLRMLARVYMAAHKDKQARETLKKALEIDPGNLDTVKLMNDVS